MFYQRESQIYFKDSKSVIMTSYINLYIATLNSIIFSFMLNNTAFNSEGLSYS